MQKGNFNRGSSSGDKSWGSSRGRNSGENFNPKNNEAKELPRKPRLVPVFPEDQLEVKEQPKPMAKAVIIANLPPKMNQCDVYTLCRAAKVSVLHVDMETIDRPHYSKVYYAHVHVRNDRDVRELVKGLNNLKLNGYLLQAYSVEKLVEECQVSTVD